MDVQHVVIKARNFDHVVYESSNHVIIEVTNFGHVVYESSNHVVKTMPVNHVVQTNER